MFSASALTAIRLFSFFFSYMTGELKFWYLSFQESELLAVACHIVVLVWGMPLSCIATIFLLTESAGDEFLGEVYTAEVLGFKFAFLLKEWLLWLALLQFFSATCIAFVRGASHAVRTVRISSHHLLRSHFSLLESWPLPSFVSADLCHIYDRLLVRGVATFMEHTIWLLCLINVRIPLRFLWGMSDSFPLVQLVLNSR